MANPSSFMWRGRKGKRRVRLPVWRNINTCTNRVAEYTVPKRRE